MRKTDAVANVGNTVYNAYDYYGYHKNEKDFIFRLWAPRADKVYLVGDFCNWKNGIPMNQIEDTGVWEVVLSDASISVGDKYKFKIFGNGQVHYKADPYAKECEQGGSASVIFDDEYEYEWKDDGWLKYRRSITSKLSSTPLNIYEVHLGAWKHYDDGSSYEYEKLASELATYVKQMGYTHIELLPVFEGAYDRGKKLSPCSFYSPSSRYGSLVSFKRFMDTMHEAGVGVILDWEGDSFSEDEHGLRELDGRSLYESSESRRFDYEKKDVVDFLSSNVMYFIKEYHVDGICIKNLGVIVDSKGGRDFIKALNSFVKDHYPDVLLIADGAKDLLNLTSNKAESLGFDLKKDEAWGKDVLEYVKEDPIFRKHHHEKTTYSLTYAFADSFILPLQSDFVCGEGKSLLDKVNGDYWQKFATVRALLGYMMTHPGKKLTFMGSEIGQFCEWAPTKELEWFLLEYESHAKLQKYISDLNNFYLASSPLWQNDGCWDGFKWIDPNNRNQSILSYRRIDSKGKEYTVVINFTPVVYEEFSLGVSNSGIYVEVFNSDNESFGGSGVVNVGDIRTEGVPCNFLKDSIKLRVPPLAMTVLQCKRKNSAQKIQHS